MNSDPKERGREPSRSGWTAPRTSMNPARTLNRDGASAEHRRKLEALFSGNGRSTGGDDASGGSPMNMESLRELSHRPMPVERAVFASPRKSLGRSPSEYRLRLERLRIAREEEEIKEAADAFLAHHQLPDDVDVLYKLLRHPSERVLREAMGQISSLLMQGRINSTILLEDRLNVLTQSVAESATQSYISGLRTQIDRLKQQAAG